MDNYHPKLLLRLQRKKNSSIVSPLKANELNNMMETTPIAANPKIIVSVFKPSAYHVVVQTTSISISYSSGSKYSEHIIRMFIFPFPFTIGTR